MALKVLNPDARRVITSSSLFMPSAAPPEIAPRASNRLDVDLIVTPLRDQCLVRRIDDARADHESLGLHLRVAHALSVLPKVGKFAAEFLLARVLVDEVRESASHILDAITSVARRIAEPLVPIAGFVRPAAGMRDRVVQGGLCTRRARVALLTTAPTGGDQEAALEVAAGHEPIELVADELG